MAPPAEADAVEARLREAAGDGTLRFDRFVEIALYSPGGFYDGAEPPLGREGSFYTAAHTTSAFGATLARRLVAERERVGSGIPFQVAELGPGDGTLAIDVARALPADGPRWSWALVERSPRLRRELAERLRREAADTPVSFRFLNAVSEEGPFAGVVLANEFLDALPFRRLVFRDGAWRELGVRRAADGWEWAEGTEPAAVPGADLPTAEAGTRYELLERSEGFVREVADHLLAGSAIFLDYGAGSEELLRAHRSGTLAALRSHRPVDPLVSPGTADLSAFVDFDRFRAAAQRSGLVERAFRGQAEALGAWGFAESLESAVGRAATSADAVKLRMQAKNLLFGFETFRVLELDAPASATVTS